VLYYFARGRTFRPFLLVATCLLLAGSIGPGLAFGPPSASTTTERPHAAVSGAAPGCPGAARLCPAVAPLAPLAPGDAWTNVSDDQKFSPAPLRGANLVYDRPDNAVLLFGGCAVLACPAPAATWKFSGGIWTNVTSGPQPPARAYAAMTFDSKDNEVVLFGGYTGLGHALADTWTYAGGNWTNVTNASTSPPGRYAASMAYDRGDSYVTLFGGHNASGGVYNDTWRFTAGTWKNLTVTSPAPPPAREGAGFAWDDADSYAVLFGGDNATGVLLNDTWSYIHGRWAVVNLTNPTTPPPRASVALSYYGQDNAVYVFGGRGANGALNDTWRYAANRWTNVTTSVTGNPPAREDAGAMESSITWTVTGVKVRLGFFLLYGGAPMYCDPCGAGARNDSWVFEQPPLVTASALPPVGEIGQPIVFSASGSSGSPPYLYSWAFGDGTVGAGAGPSTAYFAVGNFTATVTMTDFAGVEATAPTTVMILPGPAVNFTVSPKVTDVGLPVAFNATCSGGTPPYTSVRWAFGDTTSATSWTASHTYSSAGTFQGGINVTDSILGVGLGGFSVTVNPALSFAVSVPTGTLPVQTGALFVVSFTGGTSPYSVTWAFGDGATATTATITHAYTNAGRFTVGLTVRDAVGEASTANYTVIVTGTGGGPGSGAPTVLGLPWTWFTVALVAAAAAIVATLLLVRRRRRRRQQEGPIAAAAVGQEIWRRESTENRPDSRSSRRSVRFGRR